MVLVVWLAGCYDARPQACPDGVCPTGLVGKDRSITMELDGAPYLMLADTPEIPPPLDLAIRTWVVGAFDNLVVDCAR